MATRLRVIGAIERTGDGGAASNGAAELLSAEPVGPGTEVSLLLSVRASRPAARRLQTLIEAGRHRFSISPAGETTPILANVSFARRGSTQEVVLALDDAIIDWDEGAIAYRGRRVTLSRTELRLLACLLDHHGQPASRAAMTAAAWPSGTVDDSANALRVYVCYLRRHLRAVGLGNALQTVRNVGHRLGVRNARRPQADKSRERGET